MSTAICRAVCHCCLAYKCQEVTQYLLCRWYIAVRPGRHDRSWKALPGIAVTGNRPKASRPFRCKEKAGKSQSLGAQIFTRAKRLAALSIEVVCVAEMFITWRHDALTRMVEHSIKDWVWGEGRVGNSIEQTT